MLLWSGYHQPASGLNTLASHVPNPFGCMNSTFFILIDILYLILHDILPKPILS